MEKAEIIEKYINSDRQTRQQIEQEVGQSKAILGSLLYFMSECAVQAVRQKNKSYIVKGLYSNVLEGCRQDSRDNIVNLTQLYHSCIILELDPIIEFKDVANNTTGDGKDLIMSFVNRKPVGKTLHCMLLKTTLTPQFDYIQISYDEYSLNKEKYSEPTDQKIMATTNSTLPKAWRTWLQKLFGSE